MMDCRTNGDVVMNAYNANDCGGAPISSTILALSATCYAYSYSLSDTVRKDTNYTTAPLILFTLSSYIPTFFLVPPFLRLTHSPTLTLSLAPFSSLAPNPSPPPPFFSSLSPSLPLPSPR